MQEHRTAHHRDAAFIWKWGATSGVMLGVIQIVISQFPHRTIFDLLVGLFGFFLLGIFAARHTGRVGTGALVGLVTGLIGGVLVVLFGMLQLLGNDPQITQALNQAAQYAQQRGKTLSPTEIRIIAVVGGLIVVEAIELSLGAGIGTLGGLLGRHQARPHPN